MTVFIVGYNVTTSLHLVGIDSSSVSSRPAPIGTDVRRIEGYRDRSENDIFGEWDWEPGHNAGVKEAESSRLVHGKPHSHPDAYVRGDRQSVGEGRFLLGEALGSTSVSLCAGACRERSSGLPFSTMSLWHLPRFMPFVETIASSMANHNGPPGDFYCQILSAQAVLGKIWFL